MQKIPALILVTAALASTASAQLIPNGDFEGGNAVMRTNFVWSIYLEVSNAPIFAQTENATGFPVIGGNRSMELWANGQGLNDPDDGSSRIAPLAGFLNVNSSELTDLIDPSVPPSAYTRIEGDAFRTRLRPADNGRPGANNDARVTVEAGQRLRFQYHYFAAAPPGTWNNVAFFTVGDQAFFLADDLTVPRGPLTDFLNRGEYYPSGVITHEYTFPTAGTFALGWGMMGFQDTAYRGAIYIDNIEILPVPEPTSAMLLAAAALAGWVRCRR